MSASVSSEGKKLVSRPTLLRLKLRWGGSGLAGVAYVGKFFGEQEYVAVFDDGTVKEFGWRDVIEHKTTRGVDIGLKTALLDAVREQAESYKRHERNLEEIRRLQDENRKLERGLTQRQRDAIVKASGRLPFDEFSRIIRESIPSRIKDAKMSHSVYDSTSIDVHKDDDGHVSVTLSFEYDKYAQPEQYGFLYREYDNTVFIDYDSPAYKREIKRRRQMVGISGASFIDGHKTRVEESLDLGDKYYLSYSISVTVPVVAFDKKTAVTIGKNAFVRS